MDLALRIGPLRTSGGRRATRRPAVALVCVMALLSVMLVASGAMGAPEPPAGVVEAGIVAHSWAHTSSPSSKFARRIPGGDAVVTYIETSARATALCPHGWRRVVSVRDRREALTVCLTVTRRWSRVSLTVAVRPASEVSMITAAFRGVDTSHPLAGSRVSLSMTSPAVKLTPGVADAALYSDVNGPESFSPPRNSRLLRVAGAHLPVRVALAARFQAASSGVAGLATWTTSTTGLAVTASPAIASTVVLRGYRRHKTTPTTTTTVPPPTTTTTVPPPTTTTTVPPSTTTTSTTTTSTTTTTTTTVPPTTTTVPANSATWPQSPPVDWCTPGALPSGPSAAPSGAVTIPAGNDASYIATLDGANKVYWFAPGTHTFGSTPSTYITPGIGSTYEGAPGAVIDGGGVQGALFEQHASGVTIKYLTIQNFEPGENEGVVNHDSGSNWTIAYNTIKDNGMDDPSQDGGGVMLGSGNVLSNNCITDNAQLGFNSYSASGNTNVTVSGNEISYNGNETQNANCGCDGGGKWFFTTGITITGNYVHDNGGPGLWGDTNNAGSLVQGNYISGNAGQAIFYEISYNAQIIDNNLVDNGWVEGPASQDFPLGAIYVSNSGGDSRVGGGLYSTFLISQNDFNNNWGGVIEWEDSNRYCGSVDGGSTSCTLGATNTTSSAGAYLEYGGAQCGISSNCSGTPTVDSCPTSMTSSSAQYWNCRWRTQNVLVKDNTFVLDPSMIPGCEAGTSANSTGSQCGYSGTFAQWGAAPYSGNVIEQQIAFHQNNQFQSNSYSGPWSFEAPEQNGADTLTFAQWQAAPYDQDSSSTYNMTLASTDRPLGAGNQGGRGTQLWLAGAAALVLLGTGSAGYRRRLRKRVGH